MAGWIGVDFDGTLAVSTPDMDIGDLGEPVPKMLARVKKWLADGKELRLLTARTGQDAQLHRWLKKYGVDMPITNKKDHLMKELWDDRAIQVVKNTGERADGKK